MVSFPWRERLEGWRVEFLPGRSGFLGSTWPREKLVEVYVRDNQSPESVAHILAHELGHALDVTHNSTDERKRWLRTRGLSEDTLWFIADGKSDFATGAGDFAEAFAAWQTGPAHYRSQLAPVPSPAQIEVLNELVRN